MSESKKIFCLIPWIHAHVDIQGRRALCDFSDPIKGVCSNISLKEYWNCQEVRDRRIMMLAGIAPPECQACSQRWISARPQCDKINHQYEYLVPTILKETAEDGSTTMVPFYYDYRFSNVCNFSCKMCTAPHSVLIEKEERKFNKVPLKDLSFYQKRIENNKKMYLPEVHQGIKNDNIRKLSWAGGEVFITSEHWEVLSYAKSLKKEANISLSYSTNLSVTEHKGLSIYEYLKHFKHISFELSIDGVGEVGEFIRTGLSWDLFYDNYKTIPIRKNLEVSFAITLTIPGILDVENLINFLLEDRRRYTVVFCTGNYSTDVMSPLILPRVLYNELLLDFSKLIDCYDDPYLDKFRQLINSMEAMSTVDEFASKDIEGFIKARKFHQFRERQMPKQTTLEAIYKKKSRKVFKWWRLSDNVLRKANMSPSVYRNILHNQEWDKFHFSDNCSNQKEAMLSGAGDLYRSNNDDRPVKHYSTNLLRNINDPVSYLKMLSTHANVNDCISLIEASDSRLNRWLNKKDIVSYKEKLLFWNLVRLPSRDWDALFPNLEIVCWSLIPPLPFLLRNKGASEFVVNALSPMLAPLGFINRSTALHFRVLLRPRLVS